MSEETPAPVPDRGSRPFRWQALLQRASEALFVLDRRRRLLFVNRAWEQLTGVPADRARGLVCRHPRPAAPDDSTHTLLTHNLTPPAEALQGEVARTRRLFAPRTHRESGGVTAPRWWDVEFFPLRQSGPREGYLLLGRVLPVPEAAGQPGGVPAVLPERLESLRLKRAGRCSFDLFEGGQPALRRLVEQARLASQVRVPALIVGEPGVGKRTLARVIHAHGPAREQAFAALDCRRLPAAAVADVLLAERQGPVWQALGTVYLSEPACLPRDLQLRLCEWLAAGSEAGPRLLVGCRRDPAAEVREGRLLEELSWRAATLTLTVPPLRERIEDLPHLTRHILHELNAEEGPKVEGLSEEALEAFRAYAWPGNLAELRQVLTAARLRTTRRLSVGGDQGIGGIPPPTTPGPSPWLDLADLPHALRLARQIEQDPPRAGEPSLALEDVLQEVERRLIRLALRRARGNRSRAAELLRIHRPRLLRRMEALGIEQRPGEAEGDEPCAPRD